MAITLVLAGLAGGCTGTDAPRSGEATPSATPSATSTPEVPVVDSPACDEVRAGIDAFNLGDFGSTVEHFEAAVPLAEEQDDGSEEAGDLVEAVHYYAELEAKEYPQASRSSPQFAKYKAITLGQCVAADDGSTDDPGADV